MKKAFTKKYLMNELDLPYSAIERQIIGNSRWSIDYSCVFEDGGKHWETTYSVGATESQDEGPWEYEDEIVCTQVEKRQVTVERWEPVLGED